MDFKFGPNSVTIDLADGETFYLARRKLRGIRKFDTKWIPPFPFGSPFVRWWYGSYWRMREIRGESAPDGAMLPGVPLSGSHSRGTFHALRLEAGKKYYISGHCLAGFSSGVRSLHTHIKIRLAYWFLEKHFFPVFEGPGVILLYSESAFEETTRKEFQPSRIAAFEISRAFRVTAPQPRRFPSQVANLFSDEVVWHFVDDGTTIAELHSTLADEDRDDSILWRMCKHVLAWFRL